MDRREMLEESFRNLTRVIPKVFGLGFLQGLDQIMKIPEERHTPPAVCFPEPVVSEDTASSKPV